MCSMAQTLKCRNRRLKCRTSSQPLRLKCRDLNVGAALIYIGLNAITTRELPNYVDCTVHQ